MKKKISQITNNKGAELLAALGGDEPVKGYAPSTPEQRANWNRFLSFLRINGYGGSTDLDKKDMSLGLKLLDEYNKRNPDKAVPKEFIPVAQYEAELLTAKRRLPQMQDELGETAYMMMPENFRKRELSPIDGWLGSRTSRLYYPEFAHRDSEGLNVNYGVDYERFSKNPTISEIMGKFKAAKLQKTP